MGSIQEYSGNGFIGDRATESGTLKDYSSPSQSSVCSFKLPCEVVEGQEVFDHEEILTKTPDIMKPN